MKLLIIGMKGRVLGINRKSGSRVWETHLKGAGFVNVYIEDEQIYAATRGELFCLEPNGGRIVWHNNMKGLGYGMVSFGWDPANQTVMAAQLEAERQAAAASSAGAGA